MSAGVRVNSYWLLFVAPCVASPLSGVLARSGARYDIGCVHYMAVAAFLYASGLNGDPSAETFLLPVLTVAVASPLRILCLWRLPAYSFTLLSLGQLWSSMALLQYWLYQQGVDGLAVQTTQLSPFGAAVYGTVMALAAGAVFTTVRLPLRLLAATESPVQFDLTLGGRMNLALQLEFSSLIVYGSAGVLFAAASYHLSISTFQNEVAWIILTALLAASRRPWLGPVPALAVTVVRFSIGQHIPAVFTELAALVLLTIGLAATWVLAARNQVVSRA